MAGLNPQALPTHRIRNQFFGRGRYNEMNDDENGAESIDKPHIRFEDDSTWEEDSDQLTLSFKGQVYVFDSVSPEKVQGILLLLGGHITPSTMAGVPNVAPQSQRAVVELPRRSSIPHRAVSSNKLREKRKERSSDKNISSVRKEAARKMQRHKGQFASSKFSPQAEPVFWSPKKESPVQSETLKCTHCKTSSKSTPVMRRGPHGPKTLCNACGLKWASKGTLKNIPRTVTEANKAEERTSEWDDESGDGGDNGNINEAVYLPPLNVDNSVAVTKNRSNQSQNRSGC